MRLLFHVDFSSLISGRLRTKIIDHHKVVIFLANIPVKYGMKQIDQTS
jgi:hypothetical protein